MSTIVNVTEDELLLSSVKPAYYPDAVMISVLTAVALVPNGAVLFYVFVRRQKLLKNLETRNIRQAITFMTGANVVSIFGFHSLLIFYFISLQFGLKLPFAICSFLRSFKQMIVSPAFYSCLLVAVERYVLIFYGYNMSPYHVLGSYVLLGLPHIVMFISQQIYYTISMQDICGYTKMSKIAQLENLINALNIIYPFLAVLLNLRMLHFVLRFKVRAFKFQMVRNLPREKVVLIGLLIQAILPLVTTTPETTMYFLYVNGLQMPKQVWRIADAIYCSFLTLNPLVTVMFVPHFRNLIINKITSF